MFLCGIVYFCSTFLIIKNEEELVEYAYKLALDLLKDKDGVYNIREYFLK